MAEEKRKEKEKYNILDYAEIIVVVKYSLQKLFFSANVIEYCTENVKEGLPF
jgi:hypothetical protein